MLARAAMTKPQRVVRVAGTNEPCTLTFVRLGRKSRSRAAAFEHYAWQALLVQGDIFEGDITQGRGSLTLAGSA